MSPLAPQSRQTILRPPDYINESVYYHDVPVHSPIYDEDHRLLGYRGVYSFRPTASSTGAIQLVQESTTVRFYAIVKYAFRGGFVVYTDSIE